MKTYFFSSSYKKLDHILYLDHFSNNQNQHQILTMENNICCPNTASSSPLPMHRNSLTISKTKPKIRIIHIFAPEIIKTDATNFRELVQRLTGKPTDLNIGTGATKKRGRVSRKKDAKILCSSKKMEMAVSVRAAGSFRHAEFRERVKGEEEEIWRSANSGGGFLGGFAEFDGFMQEINQFPFLEGTTPMLQDAYGLSQLA